jgi:hypothetical protein
MEASTHRAPMMLIHGAWLSSARSGVSATSLARTRTHA